MRVDRPCETTGSDRPSAERERWERHVEDLRETASTNTERAIRSDLSIYTAWCSERGVEALPASAETLATFVGAMAAARAPATVRRYLSSIASVQRALGFAKTTQSEPVQRALRRMHKRNGRRQGQARGLTGPLRTRLLGAAGDTLIDARNRALLSVAYDTLLRRAELVALDVEDINEEIDGAATVLVRRSKSDPEGRGATAYIASDSMTLVHEWLERSAIDEGKIFRSLVRGAVGQGLDAGQVSRIFKGMARTAGLPSEVVEQISGHSTRVGATQDMVAGGIEMPAILHAGRWKSTAMVNRYSEHLLARRSGAAQLARLQHRE